MNQVQNVLNLVVDFKTLPTTVLPNNNYVRKMAIFVEPKASVTDTYKEVFNVSEAGTYIDDTTAVDVAFKNGARSVFLAFNGLLTDATELNFKVFSLCFANETIQSAVSTTGFLGVVYNGATGSTTESKALAQKTNNVCVLAPTKANELSIAICAKLISGNSWRPIVLTQFADYEATPNSNAEASQLKTDGFTFLIKDNLQVTNPTLWDVFAGGLQAIRVYILENLKLDIQTYIYNRTANAKPFYTTPYLINLRESVIANIIEPLYLTAGLIDAFDFNIPIKEAQSPQDILNGIVANITIKAKTNGGINQHIGEAQEMLD